MSRYPVPGLSKRQREVFEAIATGHRLGHPDGALKKLLELGAIEQDGEEEICRDRFGVVRVPSYFVPFALHRRWCEWCSEHVSGRAA